MHRAVTRYKELSSSCQKKRQGKRLAAQALADTAVNGEEACTVRWLQTVSPSWNGGATKVMGRKRIMPAGLEAQFVEASLQAADADAYQTLGDEAAFIEAFLSESIEGTTMLKR